MRIATLSNGKEILINKRVYISISRMTEATGLEFEPTLLGTISQEFGLMPVIKHGESELSYHKDVWREAYMIIVEDEPAKKSIPSFGYQES